MDFKSWTVKSLKDELKSFGLSMVGDKEDLIKRLEEYSQATRDQADESAGADFDDADLAEADERKRPLDCVGKVSTSSGPAKTRRIEQQLEDDVLVSPPAVNEDVSEEYNPEKESQSGNETSSEVLALPNQHPSSQTITNDSNSMSSLDVSAAPMSMSDTYASPQNRSNAPTDTKIFVGGLHPTITEPILRQHFSEFGPIKMANIVYDRSTGMSKGYAFIEYESIESVDAAVKSSPFTFYGKNVDVKRTNQQSVIPPGQDPALFKIYVQGLDVTITESVLTEALAPYGRVTSINIVRTPNGLPKGYAFIQFSDTGAVETLVQKRSLEVAGRILEFGHAQNKKKAQANLQATQQAAASPYYSTQAAYANPYGYAYAYAPMAQTSSTQATDAQYGAYVYPYSQYYGGAYTYSYPQQ